MRESNSKGFDLKVRSLLEDAEVDVPASVWDALSSRLDGPAAVSGSGSHRVRWQAVAGVSLALAAAIVAGVFIFRSPEQQSIPATENLVSELVPQPSSQDITSESLPAASYPVTRSSSKQEVQEALAETVIVSEPAGNASTAPAAQVQEGSAGETPNEILADPSEFGPSTATLLAQLEWEEEKAAFRPGLSLELNGALGSNDSRLFTGNDKRSFMSSGDPAHTRTSLEEESVSSYDIPLSFGVGVRFQLVPKFSIGVGIDYSLLGRTFTGTYTEVEGGLVTRQLTGDVRHRMQYIGIPVSFYYDFVQAKFINCYVFAGGTAEYCVSNRYLIEDVSYKEDVQSLQYSLRAGLGVEFMVSKHLGIYIDPGVSYYFRCDQPKSIRTVQPFMVNFEAGLRFDL